MELRDKQTGKDITLNIIQIWNAGTEQECAGPFEGPDTLRELMEQYEDAPEKAYGGRAPLPLTPRTGKYELKKDTFFYKAGTICKLTEKGNMVLDNCEGACILHKYQLESHPDVLDEWFEKIEEKKYGGRVPKNGDRYWIVCADGSLYETLWTSSKCNANSFESGSAFWTHEEAEKELKRRKAYVILKDDTKGFKPDWKDLSKMMYIVCYDGVLRKLAVATFRNTKVGELAFATEADAEASIKAHEKEWKVWLLGSDSND